MLLEKKTRSFLYAVTGVRVAWHEEHNFRFELLCAFVTIVLGVLLGLTRGEFVIVIFLIGFVLTAELLNTALEEFCDMVKKERDPHIGKIKDLAAAAVLVASATALVIGCVIFLPHIAVLV